MGTRSDPTERSIAGQALPPLVLESTSGDPVDLAALGADLLVLFVHPHTTGGGAAPVPGWDAIPGARGCTAQSCAFRDHHAELCGLGASVAGLSSQPAGEQRAFAGRFGLAYPLLSDPRLELAAALGLPTFEAAGRRFYRRLTLIARAGRIEEVFYPVLAPERNASEVIAWLGAEPQRACRRGRTSRQNSSMKRS